MSGEQQRAAPGGSLGSSSGSSVPLGFQPPLRPTHSGAASLGEAAAERPPGAGSSLARFGDPGHPQWPPLPAPVPGTHLSCFAGSLTINNGGTSFVWTLWKEGRKRGSSGQSGGKEHRRMKQQWQWPSFRSLRKCLRLTSQSWLGKVQLLKGKY